HRATLRYVGAGGDTVSLKVDVRTRGIFRLKECAFPPLRLDFPESRVHGTVFAGQDKLKLVTHCRNARSPYEQNVLQEYVLYPIPYDFDFAGVIAAPYATPPPQLPIRSVRQRWYRGFCQPDTLLASVLARFRAAKDSIYALYRSVPDLSARDSRQALDYFDA